MPVDHYENFPVASLLLPKRLRLPIEAIYRFARSADDVADEGDAPHEARIATLLRYQETLHKMAENPHFSSFLAELALIFLPLQKAINEHALPISLFLDLLSAFLQDITQKRYATYHELLDYARRSANPVGRLLLDLYGITDEASLTESDAICTALQLTNFWQGVSIDWQKNRIYLPEEDLLRFGVSEQTITEGQANEAWQNLMRFQIARTQTLFQTGEPLLKKLPGRFQFEIRLTIAGGRRILEKIEKANYNVFTSRPLLKKRDWLRLLIVCSLGRWA